MLVIKTKIPSLFRFFYDAIVRVVMPPLCAHCKSFLQKRAVFCSDCYAAITPVVSTDVEITKTKKIKLFAVCAYKDPVRSLILSKHRSDIVSARQLGQLVCEMTYVHNVPFDYIVPVPLHWTRFAQRGFNQAEQMARMIAKKTGKPVVNMLQRRKKTKFQAVLDKTGRVENLKDAFVLRNKKLKEGAVFLLVDDLFTTGATLKSAARCLYQLKPESIVAVVASRVV